MFLSSSSPPDRSSFKEVPDISKAVLGKLGNLPPLSGGGPSNLLAPISSSGRSKLDRQGGGLTLDVDSLASHDDQDALSTTGSSTISSADKLHQQSVFKQNLSGNSLISNPLDSKKSLSPTFPTSSSKQSIINFIVCV